MNADRPLGVDPRLAIRTGRTHSLLTIFTLLAPVALGLVALCTSLSATMRPPVIVNIFSEEALVPGQETTVMVTIRGAHLPNARFDLQVVSADWKHISGEPSWSGSLQVGETVWMSVRVVPNVENPEPLRGWLSVDGWPDTEWLMDMRPSSVAPPTPPAQDAPGQGRAPTDDGGTGQAKSTITATGRFVYIDDGGNRVGIKGAKVVMYDNDAFAGIPPSGCASPLITFGNCRAFMGATVTDENGFFTVLGAEEDLFGDRPDPYVTVEADCYVFNDSNGNPVAPAGCPVIVQTPGLFNFTYCFASDPITDVADQMQVNFGEIQPTTNGGCGTRSDVTGENGAWQLFNNAREAWITMRGFTLPNPGPSGTDTGGEIPKVRIFWPDFLPTFYRPGIPLIDDGGITVHGDHTWNEAILFHEYGHHVLYHFAESPLPDYNNGTCDTIPFLLFGGHCVWHSEKGSIHWTEGWPNFLSQFLSADIWNKNNTASSTWGRDVVTLAPGSLEFPPHPHPDQAFSSIEEYTAAILWDQYDAINVNEDHDLNGSRDQMQQSFATQWDVVVNFDPDPIAIFHNHPTSIDEFWDGYASRFPFLANRLSEIYDENHIPGKQAADLQITALTASTTVLLAGDSFSVTDTTANGGSVTTGQFATTRFSLVLRLGSSLEIITPIGERSIPPLGPAGATSMGTTAVGTSRSLAPGMYFVRACVDAGIFQSNRRNDCLDASARVEVLNLGAGTVVPIRTNTPTPTATSTPTVTLMPPTSTPTATFGMPSPNLIRIHDCVGQLGRIVSCAVELLLQPGVELATFQFAATILPNGSAPALTSDPAFVAVPPLPTTLNEVLPRSGVLVGWLENLAPRVMGNRTLGILNIPIPGTAQAGQTYRLRVEEPSATSDGSTNLPLSPGADATLTVAGVSGSIVVCDTIPGGNDGNADGDMDDAGEFGNGDVTNLDAVAVFRASLLPSQRPPSQSDRFDAMDAVPEDIPPLCGGNGTLLNNDAVLCLRRALLFGTGRGPFNYERSRAGNSCTAQLR